MKNALLIRAALLLWTATLVAACGGSSHPATAVGVGIGVTLSSPTGSTIVTQGTTLEVDANVSNDKNAAGVTWSLTGAGSIASSTNAKVIYQAPSGVVGSDTATLTATSIADTTQSASVTLTVNGVPTIIAPVLFPANANLIYASYISVAGGTAPYTWTLSSGTLPAGLALNGSTTGTVTIQGTPTTVGTSHFTLKVADSNSGTASVDLTLTINAQTACLLQGRYVYLVTGLRGSAAVTRAGTFNVTSDGTITGVYDIKDAGSGRSNVLLTAGTCKTTVDNRGTLSINSAGGGLEGFNFATGSSLSRGFLIENDGSGVVGSGQFFKQDATALSLATLAGDYVFGAAGDNGGGRRLGVVGRMSLDAAGLVSGGVADTNAATPVAAGALTGSFTAPDANGRGTATLSVAGQSLPVSYYVVDATHALIVSNDTSGSTPRIAGQMTRQTGAGTLSASSLAQPAVLSLWGAGALNGASVASDSVGLLSGASPSAGTLNVQLDISDRGASLVNQTVTAAPYTVAANGRGTLVLGTAASTRNFVLYANGIGGGFILEPASVVGNFGILEQQTGAPYNTFPPAYFLGGTLYPGSSSPITLAPQLLFQNGSLAGNVTGIYAIDPTTGRVVASVSRTVLGGTGLVMYLVSPQKVVILGNAVNTANTALSWFEHY